MWNTRFELDLTSNGSLPIKYPTQPLWGRDIVINNERQYYIAGGDVDDVLAREENGLVIRARKRRFGEDFTEQEWLSGMFTSWQVDRAQLNPNFRERILFKLKLPVGTGAWPAAWLLPNLPKTAEGNPDWSREEGVLAELDAMEHLSYSPHIYYSTVHTRDNPTGVMNQDQYTHNCPEISLPGDFHTWGYERDFGVSRWSFDGDTTKEFMTPADLLNRELFFIVNLAVGGNWSEKWSENWPPTAEYFRLQIASIQIQRWDSDNMINLGDETEADDTGDQVLDVGLPGVNGEAFSVLTDPSHPNYGVAKGIQDQAAKYCECIQEIAMERIKQLQ